MEWIPHVPEGDSALFVRLSRAIIDDIRGGRLRAGDKLPGARTLAEGLGVHRNTVATAYRELVAQGFVVSAPRSGMRVAAHLSAPAPSGPRRQGPAFPQSDRPLPGMPPVDPPGVKVLHGGRPDLRLLPLEDLARAWRRALRGGGRKLVDYGDPRGLLALRKSLSAWLRDRRGLVLFPDQLLVTRGSQQALYLASLACFKPGDRVAVEGLGYRPAWDALRLVGVVPVPVPVDPEGIDLDALEKLDVRGVYVTPHHQYPTMVGLSSERRERILRWAVAGKRAILEDDYDHEMHYAGRPRLPLAHADDRGVVVYIGTLSKALAPGLRVGFVSAHGSLLDAMTRLRVAIDRQGDAVTERAVAELIDEGLLDRHIHKMHKVYEARGRHLAGLVRGLGLAQPDPEGGLALWTPSPVEPLALRERCLKRGVGFRVGQDHTFSGEPDPHLRLGFANLDEAELDAAVKVIGEEISAMRPTAGAGGRP